MCPHVTLPVSWDAADAAGTPPATTKANDVEISRMLRFQLRIEFPFPPCLIRQPQKHWPEFGATVAESRVGLVSNARRKLGAHVTTCRALMGKRP